MRDEEQILVVDAAKLAESLLSKARNTGGESQSGNVNMGGVMDNALPTILEQTLAKASKISNETAKVNLFIFREFSSEKLRLYFFFNRSF